MQLFFYYIFLHSNSEGNQLAVLYLKIKLPMLCIQTICEASVCDLVTVRRNKYSVPETQCDACRLFAERHCLFYVRAAGNEYFVFPSDSSLVVQ
uniref:Uncharacterized protein n=1 Tax=Anguilla anguilla TaxID=7936 RepID=A0A0E9WQ42_ANGAN